MDQWSKLRTKVIEKIIFDCAMESYFPDRDWTHTPCIGRMES